MAGQVLQRELVDFNFWNKYTDIEPQTFVPANAQQYQAFFRHHPFQVRLPQGGNRPRARDFGDGQLLERPPARDLDPVHRQFLDTPVDRLDDNPGNPNAHYWTGTKYLGDGGFGQVGLWEYQNPDLNARPHTGARHVVVKEGRIAAGEVNDTLWQEAENHLELYPGGSQHIVSMLLDPPKRQDIFGADEGLGPEWDGVLRRIYLEYCELGDLYDLLRRRIRLGVEFSELALWRIFDCLVDGASALEDCYELQVDLAKGIFDQATPPPKWRSKVHFDLKPHNILLADRRTLHSDHPLCKIGDLGFTRGVDQPPQRNVGTMALFERWRRIGTEGYYAPEQFSEEWDYNDYQQSNVAGQYGPPMNIWGIGCIMYQLAVLTLNAPNQRDPFLPGYNLNAAPPLGITYGVHLDIRPYSSSLKDAIQACLYDDPRDRPILTQLKERITDNIQACIQAGAQPEPWVDYLPAEPLPTRIPIPSLGAGPTQAQRQTRRQAQAAARNQAREDLKRQPLTRKQRDAKVRQRCNHLKDDNTQCKNKFSTTRMGTEMYCKLHRA